MLKRVLALLHIALPGRFLVYMPTVEHVGVSRKIESDSERHRLRKIIQTLRAEEDVPSGGFIVRTAGVGVAEREIRQDVRYLVRTCSIFASPPRSQSTLDGPSRSRSGPAAFARSVI